MPTVELLPPTTASASTPGWTYIVDNGYDPSKAPLNPKHKKRQSTLASSHFFSTAAGDELSARQQTAIARRIAELERDNDPKVQIAVPQGEKPKTPAARKILQYQRQIKHWLDDEEAQASAGTGVAAPRERGGAAGGGGKRDMHRRQSTRGSISVPPTPTLQSGASTSRPGTPTAMGPSQTTQSPAARASFDLDDDEELLLSPRVILPPSPRTMAALLAHPPLTYAQSRVPPPPPGAPPQRRFCENCGYWGVIRCKACGGRVCGLECLNVHESGGCGRGL